MTTKRTDKVKNKEALERYLKRLQQIKEGTALSLSETRGEQEQRIAKAKKNIDFFVETYLPHYATSRSSWFHRRLARKIKRSKTLKGLLPWGRGLGKSVWADVILPLWLWVNDDIHFMVLAGVNKDAAELLLQDLRAEFEANQLLIHDFGAQKRLGQWEDGFFVTRNGFIAKAIGAGQSPRGLRYGSQRPDYIVADDMETKELTRNPRRQDQVANWILEDLIPTMDGDIRRFLMANNQFAPRTIMSVLEEKSDNWWKLQVNAYDPVSYEPAWPEKYSDIYYKELEQEIGILAAHQEYNNSPHIEGKIFKAEQINWVPRNKWPRLTQFQHIVSHWDIAYAGTSSSDYNAVRVWGLYGYNFYLIASFVLQCKMKEPLRFMSDLKLRMPSSVHLLMRFESQFWNDAVRATIDEVEDETGVELNLVKVDTPRSHKYDRMLQLQPYYQNGRIFMPEHEKSNEHFVRGNQQLFGIEPGYKTPDDSPDADQQCIAELSRLIRVGNRKAPVVIPRPTLKRRF